MGISSGTDPMISVFYRGLKNNSSRVGAALAVGAPTATEPVTIDTTSATSTNVAVVKVGTPEMLVVGFGTDNNNETFSILAIGWRRAIAASGESESDTWIPQQIANVKFTLNAGTLGVAGGVLSSTEFIADIVASTGEFDGITDSNSVTLKAGNIRFKTVGFEKVEFQFGTSTAATANVFYSQIGDYGALW